MADEQVNQSTLEQTRYQPRSDARFCAGLCLLFGFYVFMILAMLAAAGSYAFIGLDAMEPTVSAEFAERHPTIARWSANPICTALASRNIQYSIALSLISCAVTTVLCLWVSIPIGYVMSRYEFRGKTLIDAILDISNRIAAASGWVVFANPISVSTVFRGQLVGLCLRSLASS